MNKVDDNNYPYPECESCKTLTDCKNYVLSDSPLSLPMPPDDCPKPIEVIRKYQSFKDKRNKTNNANPSD